MKPKLTIVIHNGQIDRIYSDRDVFLKVEVHNYDENPRLVEQQEHDPIVPVHFTERIPHS